MNSQSMHGVNSGQTEPSNPLSGILTSSRKILGTSLLLSVMALMLAIQSGRAQMEQMVLQQEVTPSETATSSPTFTSTLSSETPTPTETQTPGAVSPSPSATVQITQSLTPVTLSSSTATLTTEIPLTGTITPVLETATATTTYLPLPEITLIYPQSRPVTELMYARRAAGEVQKQRHSPLMDIILRLWPLGVLLFVWAGLGIWLLILQRHLD